MSTSDTRLQRLVSSEICKAKNVEKYATELKRLATSAWNENLLSSSERLFKALGDATRLRMIKMLAIKEMCVCEIMVALDLTQPNASHHLEILGREGIVKKRKEGKWVFYSLAKPKIIDLLNNLS
ncbi:MAG: winged helix-turn-helix transcriptional regulator [archaeon]|nr:winged helix-turn-helix transcriptional regulator [archaeon]MCP8322099.1 winged helix-turn-helix transcriptional regulator [archaeon]